VTETFEAGAIIWTPQGTESWKRQRLGKVTASRVSDVITKTKTGWGAGRANYMAELVIERLTGVPTDGFTSPAMAWGTATEPQARTEYQFMCDAVVRECGFVDHPTIPMTGASPDGEVGDEGLLEIKCPNTATMLDVLLSDSTSVPPKYLPQIQWQLACTGRQWCDFVMYDPRLPINMQMFVKRVHRDEKMIADLAKQIIAFLAELDEKVAALRTRYETDAAA
jgi:putative phage-type endonuclease